MERKKINWSRWVHLLGVMSDEDLAKKIGCTPATVWYHRDKIGKPALYARSTNWAEYDHLLGTIPDNVIAKEIGCSINAVCRRRNKAGIPPFFPKSPPHARVKIDWTQWDHLLGTMTDAELSRKIGCATKTVWDRRKVLGISPKKRGTARKGGKYTKSTAIAIDWSKWDDLMGLVPDVVLAEKIKCTKAAVHLRRKALGIPSNRERLLKKSTIRTRTCRTELGGCGRAFQGGPRAWYCPECRERRAKETNRHYRQRKAKGLSRTLGDEDTCEVCGGPYMINGSHQRYCPQCAPDAIKETDAKQGMEYYRKNADTINPVRNRKRRKRPADMLTPCGREGCANLFVKRAQAVVCPECRPEWRRQQQKKYDAKRRGKSKNKE